MAALIYVGRHLFLIRFGRLGLLKPTLFWKPLTPKQGKACDKATASDFIQVYVLRELSAEYANISDLDPRLQRFAAIIEVYNSGAYGAHSIKAGARFDEPMGDAEAGRLLSIYENMHGLSALPRPQGLIDGTVAPTSSPDRGYKSPYAFWDDAGLHLEYPGPNWREAG